MHLEIRTIKLLFPLLFSLLVIFNQSHSAQTAGSGILPTGYICGQTETPYGIIFTDEHNSAVYLTTGGKTEKLFSSPGCGRYYSISKGGDRIGYKLIDPESGKQTPMIYDLKERRAYALERGGENGGQVTFADDGTIAYTSGNTLIILRDSKSEVHELGTYCNRAPISPDARFVIYRDKGEQLWLLELRTGQKRILTDSKEGYANAVWSPDSKFIAFTNNSISIYTVEIGTGEIYYIGEGESPQWSPDGGEATFYRKEIDFQKSVLINSDIFIAGSRGEYLKNITNSPTVCEMEPRFSNEPERIIYNTYDKREIRSLGISQTGSPIAGNILYTAEAPLQIEYFRRSGAEQMRPDSTQLMDWYYIHQVYDTRQDWGEGRSCCGASSAMEVISSYGILAPAPISTFGHISYFGKYISDSYTYNGHTFSGFNGWPTGGHGYLWNGSGSPYSNIVNYLGLHGISSSRTDNVLWANVTTEINQGYAYIVCTTQLTAAHIVVIIGTYGTGHSVVCNDPYGNKNIAGYGYNRNGKNAIYDWSDANTGHEKITPVVWAVTAHFTPTASPYAAIVYPANNSDSIRTIDTISIMFSQPMDKASTEGAFSITPAIAGSFIWTNSNHTLSFKPAVTFQKLTQYHVTISTSAKNFWNIPLNQNLSLNFKTQSREKLIVEKTYPINNQTEVSTTVQMRVQFDAQVLLTAMIGNVKFCNKNNEPQLVSNIQVFTQNGKGYLYLEPEGKLENNKEYYLFLSGVIADTSGMPLRDTIRLNFTTEKESYISGSIVDDFESINNWKVQKGGTAGIDTVKTQIVQDTDRRINGLSSGRIDYTFTGSSGYCQVLDLQNPVIYPSAGSEFGIWVFGDCSNNIMEYWFNVNGSLVKVLADTINWTGWKIKRIPASLISGSGEIKLNSVVIKQTASGMLSGGIYLDDAQYNVVMGADKGAGAIPKNFSLSQNYPNPFNPSTLIQYEIPSSAHVTLRVYDLLGREIALLVDDIKSGGRYSVNFSKQLPSGIYYYTLRAGNYSASKKMIILK